MLSISVYEKSKKTEVRVTEFGTYEYDEVSWCTPDFGSKRSKFKGHTASGGACSVTAFSRWSQAHVADHVNTAIQQSSGRRCIGFLIPPCL